MASTKFVDLRKIENFTYLERISKGKVKRANFRISLKKFRIADGHLTYKGKRRVIFDNDRKLLIPQQHSCYLNLILIYDI